MKEKTEDILKEMEMEEFPLRVVYGKIAEVKKKLQYEMDSHRFHYQQKLTTMNILADYEKRLKESNKE